MVWFRNDLRLHDHAPLYTATQQEAEILPIYIYEHIHNSFSEYGFKKTGPFRQYFIWESVHNLRCNLRSIGSELIVRTGNPLEIIPYLVKKYHLSHVYTQSLSAPDERNTEKKLDSLLFTLDCQLTLFPGETLYHISDLPFTIPSVPDVFTKFRIKVEKECTPPPLFPKPQKINTITHILPGEIPELQTYHTFDMFKGGETFAESRLNDYIWKTSSIAKYFETRNQLWGKNYASQLSPWLALGCISPRTMYYEIKKFEIERIQNKSTYWLYFELLWRDFFKFQVYKYKSAFFKPEGIKNARINSSYDAEKVSSWIDGTTENDLVNACMLQLKKTGFISNRARQITASYFIHNLKQPWIIGASWFESILIDYDACSNYGNWAYIAGQGNDPKNQRIFNMDIQEKKFDPERKYIQYWKSN